MNTLAMRPRGEYCTDRVIHACLVFAGAATELAHTYKLLKPHLDFLLFQAVFPELRLSDSEIQVCSSTRLQHGTAQSYRTSDNGCRTESPERLNIAVRVRAKMR